MVLQHFLLFTVETCLLIVLSRRYVNIRLSNVKIQQLGNVLAEQIGCTFSTLHCNIQLATDKFQQRNIVHATAVPSGSELTFRCIRHDTIAQRRQNSKGMLLCALFIPDDITYAGNIGNM